MRRLTKAISILVLAPLRLVEVALQFVLGEPPTREPITRERAKYDLDFEKKGRCVWVLYRFQLKTAAESDETGGRSAVMRCQLSPASALA
jgi:hypothetical protein